MLDTLRRNNRFGGTLTIFFTTVHDPPYARNLQGQDKVIEKGIAATVIKYPCSSSIQQITQKKTYSQDNSGAQGGSCVK